MNKVMIALIECTIFGIIIGFMLFVMNTLLGVNNFIFDSVIITILLIFMNLAYKINMKS